MENVDHEGGEEYPHNTGEENPQPPFVGTRSTPARNPLVQRNPASPSPPGPLVRQETASLSDDTLLVPDDSGGSEEDEDTTYGTLMRSSEYSGYLGNLPPSLGMLSEPFLQGDDESLMNAHSDHEGVEEKEEEWPEEHEEGLEAVEEEPGTDEMDEDPDDDEGDFHLFAFGANFHQQLGLSQIHTKQTSFVTPKAVKFFSEHISLLTCGSSYTMVVVGEKLYCFGENTHGQLGFGDSIDCKPPSRVSFFQSKVTAVAGGLHHTIVKTDDGKLFSFGRNTFGELGIKTYFSQSLPQNITFFNDKPRVVSFGAGPNHSLVVTGDGTLYGFGNNSHGQLGIGNVPSTIWPVQVAFLSDKKVVKVAIRGYFSLVITDEGQLFSFGDNSYGQLGLGHKESQFLPQLVVTGLQGKKVVNVAVGMFHSMILTEQGQLYACGSNGYGQLGIGTTEGSFHTPQLVSFFANKRVVKVGCGLHHTLIVTDDDQVFSFGKNTNGQLGLGNTHVQPTPQQVTFFSDMKIRSVTCGHSFSMVLTAVRRSHEEPPQRTQNRNDAAKTIRRQRSEPAFRRKEALGRGASENVLGPGDGRLTIVSPDPGKLISGETVNFKIQGPKSNNPQKGKDKDREKSPIVGHVRQVAMDGSEWGRYRIGSDHRRPSTDKFLPGMEETLESEKSPPKFPLPPEKSTPCVRDNVDPRKGNPVNLKNSGNVKKPNDRYRIRQDASDKYNVPAQPTSVGRKPEKEISDCPTPTPDGDDSWGSGGDGYGSESDSIEIRPGRGGSTTVLHEGELDELNFDETERGRTLVSKTVFSGGGTVMIYPEDETYTRRYTISGNPEDTEYSGNFSGGQTTVLKGEDGGPLVYGTTVCKEKDGFEVEEGTLDPLEDVGGGEPEEEGKNSRKKALDSGSKKQRPTKLLKIIRQKSDGGGEKTKENFRVVRKTSEPVPLVIPKVVKAFHKPLIFSEDNEHGKESLASSGQPSPLSEGGRSGALPPSSAPSFPGGGVSDLPQVGGAMITPSIPPLVSSSAPLVRPTELPRPLVPSTPHSGSGDMSRRVLRRTQSRWISPFAQDLDTQQAYISDGNHTVINWHSDTSPIPLSKNLPPQAVYPKLQCVRPTGKKPINPAIFKIRLQHQGPVKLKKTHNVMSMFIGDLNSDSGDYSEGMKVLGNPRDILMEKRSGEISTKFQRNFIFVYETMPMDPGRKICGLECEDCDELEDFCGAPGLKGAVVGKFKPRYL